ncbi:MAG: CrcB family protein [Actinobacteria bacterium]|nr:CrcB family protein [Actinomycetota bacterium]
MRTRRQLAVFIGGGFGAGARAAIASLVSGTLWATFGVNIVGAYALGYLLPRLRLAGRSRMISLPLLGVGFLGAFTTFSTFAVQLWHMPLLLSVTYAAATVASGVVAGAVGLRQGRGR